MSEEVAVVEAQPEVEAVVSTEPVEQPVAEETTEPTPEMFKVKYNHEEKEITLDEAREYAQKGMNYDKVMEKLEALESSPSLDFVKRQAEKYNMSVDAYLDATKEEEVNAEIQEIADAKSVPLDIAKELYDGVKLKKDTVKAKKIAEDKEKQESDLREFVEKYPDVKDLSQDVWDRHAKGDISLVDAYANTNMKSELETLREKLAKYEAKEEVSNKNTENAGASTGSVTGNGTSGQLYTKEQVKSMSREETMKNYPKIIASQKSWK